tara:strand:- start:104 stop:310 length:207 start_codon:yes stop_codon:yes gene_type:complete
MDGLQLLNTKNMRNNLLRLSDYTQFNDSPLSDEKKVAWATYRQELRDLMSNLDDLDHVDEVTWPIEPQ